MKKITIKEYKELKNKLEYNLILSALKPSNLFCNKKIDINILTFADVRKLFKLINTEDIDVVCELFKIAFKVKDEDFWSENIEVAFSAKNYLVQFLKELNEKETKLLKSIDINMGLWEQAGGNNLNKFSDIMPLVQLGEIYGIYPFDLQYKPYNEILLLLVVHKEKSEVQNNYSKLISKK